MNTKHDILKIGTGWSDTAIILAAAVFGPRTYPSVLSLNEVQAKQVIEKYGSKRLEDQVMEHRYTPTGPDVVSMHVLDDEKKVLIVSHWNSSAIYYDSSCKRAQEIIEWAVQLPFEEKESGRLLIMSEHSGDARFLSMSLNNRRDDDLLDYYNEDLRPVHERIIEELHKKNRSGLVILHGSPGTGKTSYIRQLPYLVKKDFLYIPSSMSNWIGSPNALKVLVNHSNSVIIMEDAEEALSRRGSGNSAASNLLNFTDGILGDALNIQVICTFNSDLRSIDPALLRPGRLIARHEFKALSEDRVRALCEKKGMTVPAGRKTLAELFGSGGDTMENKAIGFATNPAHPSSL